MNDKSNRKFTDQYLLRLPQGMRERLKKNAEDCGVSLNAIIVERLDDYDSRVEQIRILRQHVKEYQERAIRAEHYVNDLETEEKKRRDDYWSFLNAYTAEYKVMLQTFSTMMLHLDLILDNLTRDYNEKGKLDIETVNKIKSLIEGCNQSIKINLEKSEAMPPPEDM